MAAALSTLRIAERDGLVEHVSAMGQRLRDGIGSQAAAHGLSIHQTGPAQMPLILFEDDPKFEKGVRFTHEALRRGVYLHPFHNMFLCGAHRPEDIDAALEGTDQAFAAIK
jgi:glutamate-1-semialdehyde 2,1-aminomutase